DAIGQAWRTALAPTGDWIPNVLSAADKRLTEVRKGIPDAGGLVIATDQDSARAYAKILKKVTGETPTVVLSDEKAASKKIDKFSADESRWMVAVRMVSEGVDVPR
ncbi:ATP-dependent helicase, partial [Streptomyces sp. SID8455]|nr:ATP-dependent helicase [Streptomyces sp. SID8455]